MSKKILSVFLSLLIVLSLFSITGNSIRAEETYSPVKNIRIENNIITWDRTPGKVYAMSANSYSIGEEFNYDVAKFFADDRESPEYLYIEISCYDDAGFYDEHSAFFVKLTNGKLSFTNENLHNVNINHIWGNSLNYEHIVVKDGDLVAIPDVQTIPGFNFTGWYLNCTDERDATSDKLYDFSTPVTSDIDISAIYSSGRNINDLYPEPVAVKDIKINKDGTYSFTANPDADKYWIGINGGFHGIDEMDNIISFINEYHNGETGLYRIEIEGYNEAYAKYIDHSILTVQYDGSCITLNNETTYKVDFCANNHNGVIKQVSAIKDQTIAEPLLSDMSDKCFDGWYLDEAMTQKYDFSSPVSSDISLYCYLYDKKDVKDFAIRIYQFVLNREPEEAGLNYWTEQLNSFNVNGLEAASGFLNSPEFIARGLNDDQYLDVMYKTFFGRDSEPEGKAYWKEQLATGAMDRNTVAIGFACSKEWADLCACYGIKSGGNYVSSIRVIPSVPTSSFVDRMYTTALKRDSEEGGKSYWSYSLSNFAITGEEVGASFFLSEEMKGLSLDNKEFVTRLYATFMDREPDEAGMEYWLNALKTNDRSVAVFGFTRSPEFVSRCIEAKIIPYN